MTKLKIFNSRWQTDAILNKKVGKPYNAVDARHVNFSKFGEGVPLWGGHWLCPTEGQTVSSYKSCIQSPKVSVTILQLF